MNSLTQKIAIGCLLMGSAGELVACGSSDAGQTPNGAAGFNNLGGGVVGGGGSANPGAGGSANPGAGGSGNPGAGGSTTGAGGTIGGGSGGTIGAGGANIGGANVGGNVGAACDATGTWAIQFKTAVKWDKKTLGGDPNGLVTLAAGAGSQTLTMLSHRTYDAASKTMTDDVQVCSVKLPKLTALPDLGGSPLNIEFPDKVFDGGDPIKAQLKSTLAADPAVGTTFTSPDGAVLVGMSLPNPITDPFPAFASITSVDMDKDSNPGVTAVEAGTGIPTSALGPNADTLFLAFRSVAKVTTGTMTTCDTSEGVLNLTSINQTIIGCKIKTTGAVCTEDQRKFVDDNSPVWQPDTAPSTIKTKRIDAAKTCADVRTMTF